MTREARAGAAKKRVQFTAAAASIRMLHVVKEVTMDWGRTKSFTRKRPSGGESYGCARTCNTSIGQTRSFHFLPREGSSLCSSLITLFFAEQKTNSSMFVDHHQIYFTPHDNRPSSSMAWRAMVGLGNDEALLFTLGFEFATCMHQLEI